MKFLLFSTLLFTLSFTSNIESEQAGMFGGGSVVIINDVVFLDSGSSSSTITNISYSDDFSDPVNIPGCNQQNCTVDASSWPAGIYEVEATTSTGGTFSDFIFVF